MGWVVMPPAERPTAAWEDNRMHTGDVRQSLRRALATGLTCLVPLGPWKGIQVVEQWFSCFDSPSSAGAYPAAGLVWGSDSALYGTACFGGSHDCGTVFKLNVDGTAFTVLYSFTGTNGDGAFPVSALLCARDGALYGTTYSGGAVGAGTVFKLNPDGSGYTVLHSFGVEEGALPDAALIQGSDGALYGTSSAGGTSNCGTVFKLQPDGTGCGPVYNFGGGDGDGMYPYAGVVQGTDGALYGTTPTGGRNGRGTVFRLAVDGTAYAVLYDFSGSGNDGACPYAGLAQAGSGPLYGTTLLGGAYDGGSVFKLNLDGTDFAVLHSFTGSGGDGAYCCAAVLQGSDGGLSGTTTCGGTGGYGTVFWLSSDGTEYCVLHGFTDAGGDGAYLCAPVVQGNDGTLYGTTFSGGANGSGGVFRVGDGARLAAVAFSPNLVASTPPQSQVLLQTQGMLVDASVGVNPGSLSRPVPSATQEVTNAQPLTIAQPGTPTKLRRKPRSTELNPTNSFHGYFHMPPRDGGSAERRLPWP